MRMTIKLKLGLTFTAVIVLSAVTATFGITGLSSLRDSIDHLVDGPAQEVELAQDLSTGLLALVRAEKNLIMANDENQVSDFSGQIVKLRQQMLSQVEKLQALSQDDVKVKLSAFENTWQQWVPVQDKMRELMTASLNGREQAENLSEGEGRELVRDGEGILADIVTINRHMMAQAKADAEQEYESQRLWLISAVVLSLLIATSAGIWICIIISRGLGRSIALANAVAEGDLDQRIVVRTDDEIKDLVEALNTMTANLRASAGVADAIAGGDLTVETRRLSDKDTLGIALERMLEALFRNP